MRTVHLYIISILYFFNEEFFIRVAIVGSRNVKDIVIGAYMPDDVTEIVSGGAKGVDTLAKEYAEKYSIKYTEFLPDYSAYGRAAPLRRNDEIIAYADEILAFWDGKSRGTAYMINNAKKQGKPVSVVYTDK